MVSVICLCYNQARFVEEALDSVISQSYEELELIVVDDGSIDDSKAMIRKWLLMHSTIPFVNLKENLGNTTAFNRGLELASGKYVIDLAADDVLNSNRVEKQIEFFEQQESNVGVIYSDAMYISEQGRQLQRHFANDRLVPYKGDVYERVIDTYFIPPPTMMIKKEVLDQMGGYDGSLAYEDFDFWIRSARYWQYAYQDDVLTYIRKSDHSHSKGWYKKNDKQLHSTFKVCKKIQASIQTKNEQLALVRRVKFELRQSCFSGNHDEFDLFFELLQELTPVPTKYIMMSQLNKLKLDLSWFRNAYHKLFLG